MVDLAEPSQTPLCFAVIGNPVAHSYSPRIHHQFAEQFGITLEYKKLLAEPGHFSEAVLDFCSTGGRGLNVTVPFKVDAWQFAQSLSDRARVAEAVNTLLFNSDGIAFGDNTDGAGLLQDIRHNLNFDLKGKRVLILGAGGAVRGILGPLIDASPAKMTIANRTVNRAVRMAEQLTAGRKILGFRITGCGFDALTGQIFDLVINGTSASLSHEMPSLPDALFAPDALAYDLVYASRPTPFMEWAVRNGAASVADGLGMLVEQAAESFSLWHGQSPKTQPVIDLLRGG